MQREVIALLEVPDREENFYTFLSTLIGIYVRNLYRVVKISGANSSMNS